LYATSCILRTISSLLIVDTFRVHIELRRVREGEAIVSQDSFRREEVRASILGTDGAAVATVQLVRVLLAVAILDVLLARLESKGKPEQDDEEQDDEEQADKEQADAPAEKTGYAEDLKHLAVAAPWGVLGGLAGIASQAPAGGIIGALVGSAAFRLLSDRPVPIRGFQVGVQILSGVVIGLGVSGEFFSKLPWLAGAGALIISTQMLLWLATGWLLAKLFRYDISTSALASSPGGISGVIAASEAGADEVVVTFIHLLRLSLVIVVVPVFVALVFGGN
jgi:membrane AbrB-like protein